MRTHWAIAAAICIMESGSSAQAFELPAALQHVPRGAQALLVVPNLAACSDEVLACLEGMDRANLLLGARPIDQVKSMSGFNIALDDNASAALALRWGPGDGWIIEALLPVVDAEAFVQGNFVEHEGSLHRRADGRAFYVMPLGSHVVLSTHSIDHQAPRGLDAAASEMLSAHRDFASRGDAFVYLTPDALQRFIRQVNAVPLDPLIDDVSGVVIAVDFDPLGLAARSLTAFKPDSPWHQAAFRLTHAPGLDRLPRHPFYVALAASLNSMPTALTPTWLQGVSAIEFMASPGAAGIAGGLLNDAVLVLETSDPTAVKRLLQEQLAEWQTKGWVQEFNWQGAVAVVDDVTAEKYEITLVSAPGTMRRQLLFSLLFGRAGCRGFVHEASDALLVTFSHRPAVLETALRTTAAESLATMSVLKAMRDWLPPAPVVEMYLNAGLLADYAQQAAGAYKLDLEMPAVAPSAPPLALGMSLSDGTAEATVIIPASLLTAVLDQLARQLMPQPAAP